MQGYQVRFDSQASIFNIGCLSFILYSLLCIHHVKAQPAKALAAFGKTGGLARASWGVAVQEVATGKLITSRDGMRSLVPASTLKCITTGAALRLLGPGYRVETRLAYRGRLSGQGVLDGDLYLLGAGDPSLGSGRFGPASVPDAVLSQWVAAAQAAGIKRVQGRVLGVSLCFAGPDRPDGWQWADVANYFGAPVSGLAWREGLYELPFTTGAPGSPARMGTPRPRAEGLEFASQLRAGPSGSGDNAFLYLTHEGQARLLAGTLPPNRPEFVIKGALQDPAAQCAAELALALAKAGVPVGAGGAEHGNEAFGSVDAVAPLEAQRLARDTAAMTIIHRLPSPTLAELCNRTNVYSLNQYAEAILRWCGARRGGEASTDKGCEAVAQTWEAAGLDCQALVLTDGSGLSLANGVSAFQLAGALRLMALPQAGAAGEAFRNSLAVLGRTGTLAELGQGTRAAGNLRAKSGTLTRVLCYTGYVRLASGKQAVFAIMVNKYAGTFSDMKKAIVRLMTGLAD